MPIDYIKYPPNWKTVIRPRILKRANNCCEHCGVKNYAVGQRYDKGKFIPTDGNIYHLKAGLGELKYSDARELADFCNENRIDEPKYIVIVLTIAHLDQDPENWQVKDERLRALCQRCHLRYDKGLETIQ